MTTATAPPGKLLNVSDAAALIGVSPGSVRRWADAGRLRFMRLPGGARRFTSAEVERFRLGLGLGSEEEVSPLEAALAERHA